MSFITDLFRTPKLPTPSAPTYPSVEEEKKKLRQGAVSRSTILTTPLGLKEGETQRKTLLGE